MNLVQILCFFFLANVGTWMLFYISRFEICLFSLNLLFSLMSSDDMLNLFILFLRICVQCSLN